MTVCVRLPALFANRIAGVLSAQEDEDLARLGLNALGL